MDGYRQTLLGRALADALQELEQERGEDDEEVDGDLLFSLFDEAMKLELRDRRDKEHWTFTHETLELSGQVTAFNRFMEDWSLQASATPHEIKLNRNVADLHLPQGQAAGVRLKLRKKEAKP